MKLSLALIALVAAADQEPAAPAEADYSSGYEEPQEYGAHSVTIHTNVCRSPCPAHSPCLNAETGTCSTKIAPYGNTKNLKPTCPVDSRDSSELVVHNTWPFWTGFALLFTPALWFLCVTMGDILDDDLINGSNLSNDKFTQEHQLHQLVAGFILLVASLAYFAMATNNGFIVRCCDGRSFYYARYIDWIITTPLILWELTSLAEDVREKEAYSFEKYYIIFLDILMIVSGLIGSLICSSEKWVFFAFSMLTFFPILAQICAYDAVKSSKAVPLKDSVAQSARLYRQAMHITLATWVFYPVVWILADGTGVISTYGEAIFYTVLDVIAKSIFGVVIFTQLKPQLPKLK